MKRPPTSMLYFGIVAGVILTGFSGTAIAQNVCGKGLAEPPFLSYGADSNLLLLFDNSGSMLDMAYIDEIGRCTDNTFDPADQTYTGLYNPDGWYKWTEGVPQWKSGATYQAGAIVYSEGIFYQAFAARGNASIGYQISDDYEVDWVPLHSIPLWTQGEIYSPKSFVRYEDQLYYTELGGTTLDSDASDGISIGGDTGVEWIAVDSTWMGSESYDAGDIVTFDGMLFKALTAVPAGTSIWDDTSWERLNEGYFIETDYEDVTDAIADPDLGGADGVPYQQDNLYLRIVSATDTSLYGSGEPVQSRVTAFAASGKLLNWLSSSKFDIQKKILTGGKYNPDTEHLVSQHRGCSARGFIKEIPVKQGVADAVITFSIKGSSQEDWIDTTDDTTRIAVLGVSTSGFIGSDREQACQDAIDSIAGGWEDNQGTTKQNITTCLDYGGTNNILAESNAAYNHSVHSCWEMVTKDYQVPSDFGQVSEVQNSCEHIYRHTFSATAITPENSGYLCYGIYNSTIPDARQLATVAGAGSDREGYVGRCWKRGDLSEGCQTVSCEYPSEDFNDPIDKKIWYRCLPDNLLYSCNDYNTGQSECKQPAWTIVLRDADENDGITCDTAATDIGGWSEADPPGINDIQGCIQSALWDYCQGLSIPEVIDPSDQVSATEVTWGMIGALIDSGIASMFGSDHALIVMKGYINTDIPPEGVLHAVKTDLRIGAMAFNDNGADTECSDVDVNDTIVKYCPPGNKDGAKIISPIKLGTATTDSGIHVDNLVKSINRVRATSWTPLAEAVYNAIGYYTQNRDMRLNVDDFQTDSDVMDGWENGRYYAPGSYLMESTLYQTESGGFSYDQDGSNGENFPNNTGVTWTPVDSYRGEWAVGESYVPYDIVSYDGKLYTTVQTGTAALKVDAIPSLGQDGPLYDSGITWEFLIDPVINYCQANYILIITEGASTADINDQVASFVASTNSDNEYRAIIDPGETTADAEADQCADGLLGSTYVDDLTYFANDPNDYYNVYPLSSATLPEENYPFTEKPKNKINTYIVTAGVPRDNGVADECNPAYLMNSAAANGGTGEAISGEDPQTLEDNLLAIFNELRQRASAGSAASVISSARGGEGAIYQAIFWPEKVVEDSSGNEISIEWVGDVHGLFLDENGFMYEDTDNNRTLNPSEDLDGDGKLDCGEDLNCNGVMDPGEDVDGDGILDLTEDLNGNGIFDILADTDGDGIYDTGLDTNGDGIPDTSEDIDGDGHFDRTFEDVNRNGTLDDGDLRVIIYYDKDIDQQKSRGCYNTSIIDTYGKVCTNAKDLEEIHFLWSANQWLSEYPDIVTGSFNDLEIRTNRSTDTDSFNADSRQRYIFTWNDDGNGIVDDGEVVDFVAGADGGPSWNAMASDFDVVDGIEVDKIIRWMRGEDLVDEDLNNNGELDGGEDLNGNGRLDTSLRSRQTSVPNPDAPASTYPITWRLGDIIHSTPMTVAAPAEGYHLIYNDFSYAQFLTRWKNRRHMVYFGANDGMLHAVNAGFYRESNNKFYLGYDFGNRSFNDNGPALGTEMWAYVPYNLRPHLKCLTGLDGPYKHKYYVDLRPRIFDVKIFEEEDACRLENGYSNEGCIHPNGWGTILVGGMRLGGTPVDAADLTGADPADNRQFISSYFILDITNPEAPPDLLGELTRENDPAIVDLGYSTVISTMAIVKHGDVNEWYLILGSGPQGNSGVKGLSDQGAKISVLPLDWLISTSPTGKEPLQIPAGEPTVDSAGGTFLAPAAQVQSFVSDLITVDFDIDPSYEDYKADAVYFGTVEGETDSDGNSGFSTYPDGTTYFNGGGHMYRLVMEPAGHIVGKTGGDPVTEPYQWDVTTLLNLGSMTDSAGNIIPQVTGHPIQPITAAPSVGTDGYNFWIYFGTGRFFDPDDKTDRQQQSYYGIKEPMEITDDGSLRKRKLTWAEVELSGNSTSDPGAKGLAKVDEILVGESTNIANAPLICKDDSYDCLELNQNPSFYNASENNAYFDRMEKYIAGTGRCYKNICSEIVSCSGSDYTDPHYKNNCTDGWYLDFWPYNNREKNVGQATLLGGLVTFTTYQPNSGVCQAEGASYLYGVYYKTGTAWYENIFGRNGINDDGMIESKLSLGRGMATTPNLHVGTGGKDGKGPKAFVQTSTGEIVEIQQENLPIKNYISGRSKWKEFTCP